MRHVPRLIAVLTILTLATSASYGVTSSFTGGDAGEGLDLDGSFLYAINVGPNAGGGQVRDAFFINDFFGGAAPNNQVSITTGAIMTATNNVGVGGWGAPNYGATANDDALETVMSSIRWSAAPSNVEVVLPNLTVGDEYSLQMLFAENCCNRGFDVRVDNVPVAAGFVPRAVQGVANNSTAGAVVEHTFTATSNTVTLTLDQNAVVAFADNNPILNGVTLEHLSAKGPALVSNLNGGVFTGGDPGEGLDFQGTFTHAMNVGGPAVQIGDAFLFDGNPGSLAPGVTVGATEHIPAWAPGANYGDTANDNALETVMQSIRWTNSGLPGDGAININLGDLEEGAEYRVQLLFQEACCLNRQMDLFVDGDQILADFSPGAVAGVTGSPTQSAFLTFDLLASDSFANIALRNLDAAAGVDANPTLSGFTVELISGASNGVPEPGTGLLALMGLAGLAARRRRAAA